MKINTRRVEPYVYIDVECDDVKIDMGLHKKSDAIDLALELLDGADDILLAVGITALDINEITERIRGWKSL